MRANKIRNPKTFLRNEPLVHTRYGPFFDGEIKPGDVINVGEADGHSTVSLQTAMRLWMARRADYARDFVAPVEVEPDGGTQIIKPDYAAMVTLSNRGGAYYDIKAPWFTDTLLVKGKALAEEKFLHVRQEGPPEGWEPAE